MRNLKMRNRNPLYRKIFPNSYKIKKKYIKKLGLVSYDVQILDDEIDPFDVHISEDGIEINTDNYNNIILTPEHLEYLYDLNKKLKNERKNQHIMNANTESEKMQEELEPIIAGVDFSNSLDLLNKLKPIKKK